MSNETTYLFAGGDAGDVHFDHHSEQSSVYGAGNRDTPLRRVSRRRSNAISLTLQGHARAPPKKTMTKHYSTTAFSTSHRSSLLGSELFPTHSLPDTGARRQNWTIQERASRRKTRRRGVIRSRAAVGGNLCRDAPAGFGFCFALSISLRPSPRVRGEYILLSSPLSFFFFFLFCLLLHLLLCLVRSTAALHRPQGR